MDADVAGNFPNKLGPEKGRLDVDVDSVCAVPEAKLEVAVGCGGALKRLVGTGADGAFPVPEPRVKIWGGCRTGAPKMSVGIVDEVYLNPEEEA